MNGQYMNGYYLNGDVPVVVPPSEAGDSFTGGIVPTIGFALGAGLLVYLIGSALKADKD